MALGAAAYIFRPEICSKIPNLPVLCDEFQDSQEIPPMEDDFFEPEPFPNPPFTAVQEYDYLDVYKQKPVIALDYNVINACMQKCGGAGNPAALECMAECHSSVLAHQGLF